MAAIRLVGKAKTGARKGRNIRPLDGDGFGHVRVVSGVYTVAVDG
jgi:hypothetical protein